MIICSNCNNILIEEEYFICNNCDINNINNNIILKTNFNINFIKNIIINNNLYFKYLTEEQLNNLYMLNYKYYDIFKNKSNNVLLIFLIYYIMIKYEIMIVKPFNINTKLKCESKNLLEEIILNEDDYNKIPNIVLSPKNYLYCFKNLNEEQKNNFIKLSDLLTYNNFINRENKYKVSLSIYNIIINTKLYNNKLNKFIKNYHNNKKQSVSLNLIIIFIYNNYILTNK